MRTIHLRNVGDPMTEQSDQPELCPTLQQLRDWWKRVQQIAPWSWRSDPYLTGITEVQFNFLRNCDDAPTENPWHTSAPPEPTRTCSKCGTILTKADNFTDDMYQCQGCGSVAKAAPASAPPAPDIDKIWSALSKLESQICRNPDLPPAYRTICNEAFDAARNLDRLTRNLCAKHLSMNSMSVGPCALCEKESMPASPATQSADQSLTDAINGELSSLREWANRAEKQNAELRAEADRLRDAIGDREVLLAERDAELERLRAENDKLKAACIVAGLPGGA